MSRKPSVGVRRSLQNLKRGGFAAGTVVLCAIGAHAAATGWLQTSGTYLYHDPANWVGGVVNNVFDSSLTLSGPLTLFDEPNYTIAGNWIFNYVQGQAGADITFDGYAFNRPTLNLGGDLHFTPQPAAAGSLPTLNFTPNVTVDLGGQSRVVEVGAGALVQTAYTGNFQNGGVIKTGAGELVLNGASYLDSIEVRAGRLTASGPLAIGYGPLKVTGASTLSFALGYKYGNAITLGAATTLQGSATFSGPIDLGGSVRTLVLGVAGDSAGDATYTFSGVISNGGLDITEATGRTGTLTLSGANLLSGGTTITGATVTATHPQAFGAGSITLNAGVALTAVSKTGGINLSGSNAIPNPITLNADVSIGGSNVFTPSVSEFAGAVALGAVTRTITGTGPVLLSGPVIAAGSAGLTVTGSGLALGGINVIPGGVTVTAGSVAFNRNEAAGAATLTLTSGGAASFSGAGVVAFPNAITVQGSGSVIGPSAAPATLSGPVALNGALSGSSIVLTGAVTLPAGGGQLSSGSTLVVQGVVQGAGQLSIASGQVTLANANTHAGGTKLLGGTLFLSNKSALGPGALTIAGGTLAAINTPMTGANAITNPVANSGNFTLAAQVPVEFSGTVNLSGAVIGVRNVLYGGSPVVTTFSGEMKGFAVTWMGDGHVSLSGANTFIGTTTIANYMNLAASVLPNVPGPLGNSSSQIALDITVTKPGGLLFLPDSVAILNLEAGVTIGRSMRVVGGTISSSGGETFLTGAIA